MNRGGKQAIPFSYPFVQKNADFPNFGQLLGNFLKFTLARKSKKALIIKDF